MSDGLKDILNNLNKDIEQEKLLQYLNDHLQDAEKNAFEQQMSDDEFMNDAVEGLQAVRDKAAIAQVVQQLNADLKKKLDQQQKRKQRRKIPEQPWVYYAIILLLLLLVVAYLVLKKMG